MASNLTFSSSDFQSYVKVSVALGKSADQILADLHTAVSSSAPSRATVFRWIKHFRSGKSDIQMSTKKVRKDKICDEKLIARVQAIIDKDPRLTLTEIAKQCAVCSSSVFRILRKELGYRKVCARWTPHILAPQNKRDRVRFLKTLLQTYQNCDPRRLDEIVTGDETWVYHYEPHRKSQNKAWIPKNGPSPQIARRNRSQRKVLYTVFFNTKGIVLQKPCKAGETINEKY